MLIALGYILLRRFSRPGTESLNDVSLHTFSAKIQRRPQFFLHHARRYLETPGNLAVCDPFKTRSHQYLVLPPRQLMQNALQFMYLISGIDNPYRVLRIVLQLQQRIDFINLQQTRTAVLPIIGDVQRRAIQISLGILYLLFLSTLFDAQPGFMQYVIRQILRTQTIFKPFTQCVIISKEMPAHYYIPPVNAVMRAAFDTSLRILPLVRSK